jgi:TPR repeat protein
MHDVGLEAEKDINEAVRLYRVAAAQGYAGAQKNLGCCYDGENGVPRDHQQAMSLYRLAAIQEDSGGFKRTAEIGDSVSANIECHHGFMLFQSRL